MSHVDEETINMLKEVMEDDFNTLLETYISDSQVRIDELKTFLAAGDSDMVRRTAHSLKGSSGNLGATGLADMCLHVEAQSKDGDLSSLEEKLVEIEAEYREVEAVMKSYLGT